MRISRIATATAQQVVGGAAQIGGETGPLEASIARAAEVPDRVCGELLILAQDGRVAQACESVGER